MKRPLEQDYTSLAAYTRALEEYCDALARVEQEPAVRYAIEKASPIPLITAEEWEALNESEDATE